MTISRIPTVAHCAMFEVSSLSSVVLDVAQPNQVGDYYIIDAPSLALYVVPTTIRSYALAPVVRVANARATGAVEIREPDDYTVVCTLANRHSWADLVWYSALWHQVASGLGLS
jgi:hypothetical protein